MGYISNNIRYNNILDFDFEGQNFLYNWNEGFDFVTCYMPKFKLNDGRKRTLLSYLTNLVWLNPNATFHHILNIAKNVNKRICLNPLDDKIVVSQIKSILNQKNQNRLYPRFTKRRILFNSESDLDFEHKQVIVGQLTKDKFKIESCEKIYSILENWNFENGKITIRKIVQLNTISSKTVIKYWSNFKDYVKDLNTSNRAKITLSKPIKPIAKQTNKQTRLVAYNSANEAEQDTIDNKNLIYLSEGFLKIA